VDLGRSGLAGGSGTGTSGQTAGSWRWSQWWSQGPTETTSARQRPTQLSRWKHSARLNHWRELFA
jgi:hypothetical protein